MPFSNLCPITLGLRTSDPNSARRRAAVLSVCWEGLVLTYRGRRDLTASEAQKIFQDALERELVRALEPHLAYNSETTDKVRHNQLMAGLYRWAQLADDELEKRQADTDFSILGSPKNAPQTSPFPLSLCRSA